jgi:hypothetical protein
MATEDLRFEDRMEAAAQEDLDESRQEEFDRAQERGDEYVSKWELDELQQELER